MKNYFRIPDDKCLEVKLDMEQVYLCQISLPMMPAREVAEAVAWELPLHIPYEEGSYYYDYKVTGQKDGMQILQVVVALKKVIADLDEMAKEKDLILTAAYFEFEGTVFNLVPNSAQRRRAPLRSLYNLGTAVALALSLVLVLGGYCYKLVEHQKLQAVQVETRQYGIWQERYVELRKGSKKMEVLRKAVERLEKERLAWSEVLPSLGSSTPENCWLTYLKQKDDCKSLELQGKAVDLAKVQELIKKLEATKSFSKVALLETYGVKGELLGFRLLLQGKGEVK